jgi:hypothetical protein
MKPETNRHPPRNNVPHGPISQVISTRRKFPQENGSRSTFIFPEAATRIDCIFPLN